MAVSSARTNQLSFVNPPLIFCGGANSSRRLLSVSAAMSVGFMAGSFKFQPKLAAEAACVNSTVLRVSSGALRQRDRGPLQRFASPHSIPLNDDHYIYEKENACRA